MNEELSNFIVKFTTQGFADVKKSLDDVNKNLDDINKNFKSTKNSGDSFFGALVKWTGLVGGLTAAFVVLKNTIHGIFDTGYDVANLYKQEQLLGVEARVLERYGLISKRNLGSEQDAYSFFGDVNELMGRFRSGKITQDDTYRFAKLGMSFNYDFSKSLSANRNDYLLELRRAVSRIDMNNADQMSIMKELIKPQSMQTLFMSNEEQFQKQMAWATKYSVLSRNESDLSAAQKMITVQLEWQQLMKDIKLQLMPILSSVLNALQPVIPFIKEKIGLLGDWVDKNADKIAKWVEDAVNWLINDSPEFFNKILEGLKDVVDTLQPIITFLSWIVQKLGGSVSFVWDTLKTAGKILSGSDSAYEEGQKYMEKYLTPGSNSGGWAGDIARWALGVGSEKEEQTIINNSATYTIKAGTYTVEKDIVLGPDGPAMVAAKFAKLYKG